MILTKHLSHESSSILQLSTPLGLTNEYVWISVAPIATIVSLAKSLKILSSGFTASLLPLGIVTGSLSKPYILPTSSTISSSMWISCLTVGAVTYISSPSPVTVISRLSRAFTINSLVSSTPSTLFILETLA